MARNLKKEAVEHNEHDFEACDKGHAKDMESLVADVRAGRRGPDHPDIQLMESIFSDKRLWNHDPGCKGIR